MMASIPNMRSTPLPSPARQQGASGNETRGDFASKLATQPGDPQVAQPPADDEPPVTGEAPSEGGGAAETSLATKAGAPEGAPHEPVIVLPFLQTPPSVPAPPTVVADETPPAQPFETPALPVPAQAAPGGRRACGTEGEGKGGFPVPDPPKEGQAPAPEALAAVKELLLRKLAAGKVGADTQAAMRMPPTDATQPDGTPAPAQPQTQATAPIATADVPQPILAALEPRLLKADGVEGPRRATELPAERRLDMSSDTEWLDRLARDIAQAGSRDTPLRFRLHPQTLGHLHVELQQGDHGTAVRLTVETEAARQLLADAQPRLAAEARAQGVRIAETHVDLTGSGREAPGDRRRQDEARQTPFIRTAPGAGAEAATVRSARAARLDRYA